MKNIKYIFEALIIYSIFLIIKILGINIGRKISTFLFLKVGSLFRSNENIKKNISNAYENITEDEKNNIVNDMWTNYGLTFAEYLFMAKFRKNKFSKAQISIKGKDILNDVIKSEQPAIFISGHFANFELMAMELEKSKIKLAAIYRPLNNFFINPFMVYIRKKYICKNQIKKGIGGTKELIDLIKKKNSIALMVDQRLGESKRYPFFGKPAHTTTLPAQLALKFNCKIIPIFLKRDKNNFFLMEILNPIDFENSEGNIGIANALFEHLSAKLPISRLQRDLTDSTVLRNVGVPFGHTMIAFSSLLRGLNKLIIREDNIIGDLEENWAVVAEAIQTILRREAYPSPYEALKGLTRTNASITQSSISDFIDTLEVNDALKAELKQITPQNYTGI